MLEKKKEAVAIALYFQIHLRAMNTKIRKKKKWNREPWFKVPLSQDDMKVTSLFIIWTKGKTV